jgi:uncharacterized protein
MRTLAAIGFALLALGVHAARFDCSLAPPAEARQDRLVWSYTDLLAAEEEARINSRLTAFARETSNRILLLIVDTLCGTEASDLAFQVGERWGIGRKGFDNGIVFLIKPTGAAGQRKVFIATGYGLEGPIPDATCKRIVENEVLPRFRDGRFAEGIEAALDVLMPLAKGEFDHKSYGRKGVPWAPMLLMAFIMLLMFLAWRGRVKRYARTNRLDFWTAMWLLSQMDRRQGGGHHGTTGGFRGFGGGGGGFGGFGGGSFGGGGAGGSW